MATIHYEADVTEGTDVFGGVWARERYDWSEPGRVTLTLVESPSFRPGTVIDYRVTPRPGEGRLVGAIVQLVGSRRTWAVDAGRRWLDWRDRRNGQRRR